MTTGPIIRRFKWQDLKHFTQLFNEVNGIESCEKAYDLDLMKQFLSQPSTDPALNCYLAEENGALLGYSLLSPELPIGRTVASGGILRKHWNRGIGSSLLQKAIEHVKQLGAAVLDIEIPSSAPSAHHLLQKHHFVQVRQYWNMKWDQSNLPNIQPNPSFSVKSFKLNKDEASLTTLQNEAFVDNWGFCPNTVEEITARVRLKRCDPEGILLLRGNGVFAAYNWTTIASNKTNAVGSIEMTGVHPQYRRKGLGKIIVSEGMKYLRSRQVDRIELQVDSSNAAARDLYLSLGFDHIASTNWYELHCH